MAQFDAEYFDTYYTDYEGQNPEWKLRHYHQMLKRRVDGTSLRVLDVGCGLGMWAAYLASAEPDWRVVGMDVDPEIIGENAARYPNVEFMVGAAGEAAPNEKFDVLTAMDVLEHVPEVESRFTTLCEWVPPGGVVAFVVPVYDGPLGPIVHLLDRDPTHIHKWSRARWLELASRELTEIRWHGIFRSRLPGGHYAHWPSSRLRRMAPAILVTGWVNGR